MSRVFLSSFFHRGYRPDRADVFIIQTRSTGDEQTNTFVSFDMFTGSTKQRKVDYSGGKKRDTERKDFLLKQARLREDRAAERYKKTISSK